ncbi:ABC transporter substrate-binding protein [Agromyces archimandritae]|uniref:Extracellular solute-binding protein n=1 Tax=Agromyces archimandritae TaxID=2781962 RepID=A0A975FMH2_9MICO|nr:extracellular solute-binding protein [Agromyces archimandritae]QTX05178.1 extracellular solute-binding protein [Agromyces archimandritae]
MTHRMLPVAALAAASALLLSGCSAAGDDSTTLQFSLYMTADSAQNEVLAELLDEFEAETGTKVEVTAATTAYENNLKVQMASGTLPDVFATHGWSVLRYRQFLEPLTEQPWADKVNPALDESMRDADGELYALPIEYTVTGINTNLDVLEAAGVDPASIETWDDFDAALAKIKASGVSPITLSGKSSSPANLADFIASNAFTDDELAAFGDGDFDTDAYTDQVLDRIQGWVEAGYINPDYVSASLDDMALQLAQGQAAFAFNQPTLLTTALGYDEDVNVGFIPLPTDDGDRYLVGGEGVNSFGVWKGGEHKDEALALLAFLAEPDHAAKLSESIGTYSGLTDAEPDLGEIQASYDTWVTPGELPTKPFFDRVSLPSGMWATMIATTDSVITGQATAKEAAEQMKTEFDTLYGQGD